MIIYLSLFVNYFQNPKSTVKICKRETYEGHEEHEGKSESKKTLFVCENPCKSVAKKIGGGFGQPIQLINPIS